MTKRYYCDNRACSFHQAFGEDSEQAKEFRRALGLGASSRMDEVVYCVSPCEGMILWQEEQVDGEQDASNKPPPEHYGALLFCADLSLSMKSKPMSGQGTRYEAVVQALARLLRELAARGDEYSAAGRPAHYDHLLLSFLRYGRNCNEFRLGGPDGPTWFTLQQLAEEEKWSLDSDGHFSLPAIDATVRHRLVPLAAVDGSGTDLGGALDRSRDLVALLNPDKQDPSLPANYGGIGPIPNFPEKKRLFAIVYSDGEVGKPGAARDAAAQLASAAPDLLTLTVFLGTNSDEKASSGGALMKSLASPCFAHRGDQVPQAYFSPDQARDLRKVIRMTTVAGLGICPTCMERSR